MARHLLPVLPILLGGVLLWLAVPRVISDYRLAIGDSAYELVAEGAPMARASLERARRSREEALAVTETGTASKQLGQVLLRDALARPWSDPERAVLLRRAVVRLRRGLALEPADLFAWYHLALAEWWRGRAAEAAAALAMSYRTGPHHPPLASDRARLAVALWPRLAPPARRRATAEICRLAPRDRETLRRFAERERRRDVLEEIEKFSLCESTLAAN